MTAAPSPSSAPASSPAENPATQNSRTRHSPAQNSKRYPAPVISPWLLNGFLAYAPFYVRRHLHTVRVSGAHHLASTEHRATVIYMNHASWWDPMIAALLAGAYLRKRSHYTPIDADALQKYKFFSRLGFFGIERNQFRGARKFLSIGEQILSRADSVLWMTPQGRFADVRERPLKFESGLANLLLRSQSCSVIPVAVEYAHWEERTPEALILIGAPVEIDRSAKPTALNAQLESRLAQEMDELARASISRKVEGFDSLLHGNAGVGGIYDLWRSFKARLRGEDFTTAHGTRQ